MKHALAPHTAKLQMQLWITRQVGDRQFCLTDVVTDLLILLKSLYFTEFGNHCIDSCYLTSFFQVGSWEGELPEDGLEIQKELGHTLRPTYYS